MSRSFAKSFFFPPPPHRDFVQNVFGFRRTEGTRKQAHYKNGPKVNKSGEIPKRKAVM